MIQDFNFSIDSIKYGEAILWQQELHTKGIRLDLSIGEHVKNYSLILQLRDEVKLARIEWLKDNKEYLRFAIEPHYNNFEYVFVVYNNKNDRVYQELFYVENEAEKFIDDIFK